MCAGVHKDKDRTDNKQQKIEDMKQVISAVIISAGIALSGWFIYLGAQRIANRDRAVAVKGLSTRDVQADFVVWPLNFSVQGDDLAALYGSMNKTRDEVKAFLVGKGFVAEDIRMGSSSVEDQWSGYYSRRPDYHYKLSATIVVATKNVELVSKTNGLESELLQRSIILNSNEWSIDYQFNGLNELKPEMIEEATKNARAVAQKFADDADCSLGSIRHANQGVFSVESDNFQPWIKHVRVVTTVDYFLK